MAVAGIVAIGGSAASAAATAPPFEPDGDAAAPYANIALFDSAGNQITGGTNLASPFAWAVSTTQVPSGDTSTKAIFTFTSPVHAQDPSSWTDQLTESATTTFKPASSLPASVPADVKAFAPTFVVAQSTANIAAWINGGHSSDTTAGYNNTIEMRLYDTAIQGSTTYWNTDLGFCPASATSACSVDGVSISPGSWIQLFPFVQATTTSLQTSATGGTLTAGSSLTLTATAPAGDAGTVQFYDGTSLLGDVAPDSGGTAVFPSSGQYVPGGGTHHYTATFVPNPNDETGLNTNAATVIGGSTSSQVDVTVVVPATTTTVQSSANPSVFGQPVTLTATVTSTSTVNGGSVAFSDNSSPITCTGGTQTVSSGTATCTYVPASVGTHTIDATYNPGAALFGGSSGSLVGGQVVNAAGTSTAVQSSANPGGQGDTITFTATVSVTGSGAGTPDGTVEFKSNGGDITLPNNCSSVAVSAGVSANTATATCATTFGSGGTFTIDAVYHPGASGDFTTSTGSLSGGEVIFPATTTTVASSANPSVFGQAVTYTATVKDSSNAAVTQGTVNFEDGGTTISGCGTASLDVNGKATCTPASSPSPGNHTITAIYNPGAAHFGGSNGTLSGGQQVNAASTTVAVTGPAQTPVSGQPVTFTATISVMSPGAGNPPGSVKFTAGATTLCANSPVSTSTEKATCTVPSGLLAANSPYSINAIYTSSNTGEFSGSTTSAPLSQTVNQANTTTSVKSSANPVLVNQSVTFTGTVSVTAPGAGSPGGNVEFKADGVDIAGCASSPVSGGKATCVTSFSSGGSRSITATYLGDSNFAASPASPVLSEQVQAVTVPGAPTGLTATAGPARAVLHWMAPASNGHSAILHYNVFDSTTPGGEAGHLVASTSSTTFTVNGLKAGTKYYFIVTAVNAVGASAPSNEASAVPSRLLGYWLAEANGGVMSFDIPFHGSVAHPADPIVGIAGTPDGGGYWMVGSNGQVYPFGDARSHGDLRNVHLDQPIVGLATTADGGGYWLVDGGGGVFAFGDARYKGSLPGLHVSVSNIIGIAGNGVDGYWLAGNDGGTFAFGSARFHGSVPAAGARVSNIVSIVAAPDGGGYWLTGNDGGTFGFGTANFHGSLPALGVHLTAPIVSMIRTQDGGGYWLVGGDGGVFPFGDARYEGSVPGLGVSVRDVVGGAS